MNSPRTIVRSYWLLAGRRLRISYNTRRYDWQAAAFLKIDVLEPKGAHLPSRPTGHLSVVLRDGDKIQADGDHLAYAQRLLGHEVPATRRRAYAHQPTVNGQLLLF